MISRNLKAMARDLQVPVIALCQLSREVDSRKDHKPVLSDLRDSGAIEQDADQVITLYRSDYYDNDDKKKITILLILMHQRIFLHQLMKLMTLFLKYMLMFKKIVMENR